MLNRYLLTFSDPDSKAGYQQDSRWFFNRAMPILTVLVLFGCVSFEAIQYFNIEEDQAANMGTHVMNWLSFFLMVIITISIRKQLYWTSIFVCPILTVLISFYMIFHDFPERPKLQDDPENLLIEEPVYDAEMSQEARVANIQKYPQQTQFYDFVIRSCFGLCA